MIERLLDKLNRGQPLNKGEIQELSRRWADLEQGLALLRGLLGRTMQGLRLSELYVNGDITTGGTVTIADMSLDGATYPSISDFINNTMSSGYISGGDISDNGNGSAAVAAGQGYIRIDSSNISQLKAFDFPAIDPLALTADNLNYIYVDYNSGDPVVAATVDLSSLDHTSKFVIAMAWSEATKIHEVSAGQKLNNFIHKLYYHSWEHDGIERASGLVTSHTGTRNIDITAGVLYWALERITTAAFDSSGADRFATLHRDSGSGWTETGSQSQINNANYDDGDGTLGALTANRYGVHWIFTTIDGDIYSVYGQGDYTLAQAKTATIPSTLPPELVAIGVFIAKTIIQEGAANFTEVLLPWTSSIGLSAASDHGGLAGLADDDHTQYTLHSLADAASDFLVASGADTFVKKTLAETGAILEADLDHGNIQGLADDDHTQYLLADGTRDLTGNMAVDAAVTIDGVDISALKTDVDNFPDELQSLTAAEVTQLQAIDATTISDTQWGYLGIMDQAIAQASSPKFNSVTVGQNFGLRLLDTNESHDLALKAGSDLTADRILSLVTGDAARTLTLSGNPTLDDWFDQDVKAATSPSFDGDNFTGIDADDVDIADGGSLITATDVEGALAEHRGLINTNTTHIGSDGTDHSALIPNTLADAANDFLVADGDDSFVKKTLAETGAILEADLDHGSIQGLTDDDHTQYVLHSLADATSDFLVASGNDAFVKKTLAETGAILEADIDHGNIQGLDTGADHSYIDQAVTVAATPTFNGMHLDGILDLAILTITADSDAVDVSDAVVLQCNTVDNNITLGGLANGVSGQLIFIFKNTTANTLTIEFNEGTGTQKFFTHNSADIVLTTRGGAIFISNGNVWMQIAGV